MKIKKMGHKAKQELQKVTSNKNGNTLILSCVLFLLLLSFFLIVFELAQIFIIHNHASNAIERSMINTLERNMMDDYRSAGSINYSEADISTATDSEFIQTLCRNIGADSSNIGTSTVELIEGEGTRQYTTIPKKEYTIYIESISTKDAVYDINNEAQTAYCVEGYIAIKPAFRVGITEDSPFVRYGFVMPFSISAVNGRIDDNENRIEPSYFGCTQYTGDGGTAENVFHCAGCASLAQDIDWYDEAEVEANGYTIFTDRESAVEANYSECPICKP